MRLKRIYTIAIIIQITCYTGLLGFIAISAEYAFNQELLGLVYLILGIISFMYLINSIFGYRFSNNYYQKEPTKRISLTALKIFQWIQLGIGFLFVIGWILSLKALNEDTSGALFADTDIVVYTILLSIGVVLPIITAALLLRMLSIHKKYLQKFENQLFL